MKTGGMIEEKLKRKHINQLPIICTRIQFLFCLSVLGRTSYRFFVKQLEITLRALWLITELSKLLTHKTQTNLGPCPEPTGSRCPANRPYGTFRIEFWILNTNLKQVRIPTWHQFPLGTGKDYKGLLKLNYERYRPYGPSRVEFWNLYT